MKYVLLILTFFSVSVFAADASFDAVANKIKAAQKAEIRSEAEVKRDRNRKPVKTMKFMGLRDDMTVVELMPGGGWYTKLLAPTLADKGRFYIAMGAGRTAKALSGKPGFEKMKFDEADFNPHRAKDGSGYTMNSAKLGAKNADMVLTFRNYHNFNYEGRKAMNMAAFTALKPGGIYGVVDHTRRHMESKTPENGRRVDPVSAIKEIQDAGFQLLDYSNLHYRADDELVYEVGRRTVTGNTDRFTLKFVKPK